MTISKQLCERMGGYEATECIRDKTSTVINHNVPIIAMTAHALKGDREKCIYVGMDDYVAKPIERQDLAAAINRVLIRNKDKDMDEIS